MHVARFLMQRCAGGEKDDAPCRRTISSRAVSSRSSRLSQFSLRQQLPSAVATITTATDKNGTVSENHGHVAVITAAQLTSPTTIALNIQGQATHNHTVDLTANEVSSIATNVRVAKLSSTDQFHSHTVTFN
jgi:hypothetical protein